ncbi:MAG TPA: hypothetical protein VG826_29240 [Pirellulales bacterium]|nr:hypothetical protein [Pirellulales bacterium]
MTNEQLETLIKNLARPECRGAPEAGCPGPLAASISIEARPGEIDVDVRCRGCHAHCHHVLDAATGEPLEDDALLAKRTAGPLPSGEGEAGWHQTAPTIPAEA